MGDPKTVLHGLAQSVPNFDGLPDKGHHGSLCLQEDLFYAWLYDPANTVWGPFEYVAFCYDFATDGGTVGAHALDVTLPENTIVWDGLCEVVDNFTSGGACTIALHVEGANDLVTATTIASAGTIGFHDIIPVGTAATALRTTAEREITLTIATNAVTNGTIYGFLRCFRSFSLITSSSSASSSSASSESSSSSSSSSASSASSASSFD